MWLSEEGIAIATNRTMRKLGVENKRTIILDTDLYEDHGAMIAQGEGKKLTVGEQYTVTIGGSSYTVTALPTNNEDGVMAYIGNISLAGIPEQNTGEPFFVADVHYANGDVPDLHFCVATNGATHITVAIETTPPIDPKYLPGVCLPVVELSTEPGVGSGAKLTSTECAALNDAFNDQMPIVCKCSLMGITLSVPMLYVNSPSTSSGYMGMSGVGDISLTLQDDGAWTALFTAKG